jgi:hypothetical protein
MQVVKNIEECQIANFLIVNNMSYEYDYPYEVETVTDSYPQYKPEFTIRQDDKRSTGNISASPRADTNLHHPNEIQ